MKILIVILVLFYSFLVLAYQHKSDTAKQKVAKAKVVAIEILLKERQRGSSRNCSPFGQVNI